jgi:hypothetical protein
MYYVRPDFFNVLSGIRQQAYRARARAIHWRYDCAMPGYRRAHVPGGTYGLHIDHNSHYGLRR